MKQARMKVGQAKNSGVFGGAGRRASRCQLATVEAGCFCIGFLPFTSVDALRSLSFRCLPNSPAGRADSPCIPSFFIVCQRPSPPRATSIRWEDGSTGLRG